MEFFTSTLYSLARKIPANNGYGFLGSGSDIAKSMASTSGWITNDEVGSAGNDQGRNNSSGFTGFPGGGRVGKGDLSDYYGTFYNIGYNDIWWSVVEAEFGGIFSFGHNRGDVIMGPFQYGHYGFSVRCMKDN